MSEVIEDLFSPELLNSWTEILIMEAITRHTEDLGFKDLHEVPGWEKLSSEIKVSLTIDSVEVPFMKAMEHMSSQLDRMVREAALKLLKEKMGNIADVARQVETGLIRLAKEKLGVEIDEEDY